MSLIRRLFTKLLICTGLSTLFFWGRADPYGDTDCIISPPKQARNHSQHRAYEYNTHTPHAHLHAHLQTQSIRHKSVCKSFWLISLKMWPRFSVEGDTNLQFLVFHLAGSVRRRHRIICPEVRNMATTSNTHSHSTLSELFSF